MIELRNRQYMTIIDCVAGEDLEVGHVVRLTHDATKKLPLTALKATQAGHVSDITGPLFAHWINDRSRAVSFVGGEDGLSFPVGTRGDADLNHFIPSGARMVALGGKGVGEIRFFAESLDAGLAASLPDPGTVLRFSSDESKLCASGDGNAVAKDVALVVDNDGVSIAVVVG